MTSKPRTIDNLGSDAIARYEENLKLFEPSYIQDSSSISQKTQIPVSSPYAPSDIEQKFSTKRTYEVALITPPPGFTNSETSVFSYQFIPSLGSYEDHDDRLQLLADATQRDIETNPNQTEKELEKTQNEKNTLENFLNSLDSLEKSWELVNSRRNQYHKG